MRCFAKHSSPYVGNHLPSGCDLFPPKLLLIPNLGATGCCTEVYNHKCQTQQNCPVEKLARRCGNDAQRQIHETFARVVRADDVLKPSFAGQCIFLEARQMAVAIVLLVPSHGEYTDCEGHDGRQAPLKRVCFPGLENGTFS
jgi:hypothetical protein